MRNPERDIQHTESEVGESPEKLAEIIESYLGYDLKTTTLRISLECLGSDGYEFDVTLIPAKHGEA